MKVVYWDCLHGAAGDMLLASLLDAGVDVAVLYEGLKSLPLGGFRLWCNREERCGVQVMRVGVEYDEAEHCHRNLADIERIVGGGGLPELVVRRSMEIFRRLAEAEARVHGVEINEVHFHEVGAVDSIVDIVGICMGLHILGVEKVLFGELAVGCGEVEAAHGKLPVPVPATQSLIEGFDVVRKNVHGEMLTPTAAAVLTTIGEQVCGTVSMKVKGFGRSCGSRPPEGDPGILTLWVGEQDGTGEGEEVLEVRTNVDDMSPERIPFLVERLFAAGALDVSVSPCTMKKGRPGFIIEVLVESAHLGGIQEALFVHSSTFGFRYRRVGRVLLDREIVEVETAFGAVRVKLGLKEGKKMKAAPEYEDCKEAAVRAGVPLDIVYRAALEAAEGSL